MSMGVDEMPIPKVAATLLGLSRCVSYGANGVYDCFDP